MEKGLGFRHSCFLVILLGGWVLLSIGCKNAQKAAVGSNRPDKIQNVNDTHNSRNSLDWAGVYTGKMPCGDCAAINAELTLNTDGTYILRYKYEGKSDSTFTKNGTFQWDATGSKISMHLLADAELTYQVVENGLDQLDQNGQPSVGAFSNLSRFTKMDEHKIEEKYWKLTQINGQPVQFQGNKEPHMILKSADSTVRGFAGCNGFGGHFELLPGNRIRFSKLISTMMACPDLSLETSFLKLLEKADNYTQHGDTLYLNKARMAPLAQFVAVYL